MPISIEPHGQRRKVGSGEDGALEEAQRQQRLVCVRHEERKTYYETLVRAAEADMRVDDPHTVAAALGRRPTARRWRAGELCRVV